MATTTMCLFYHPVDKSEQANMQETLAYFTKIGDKTGVPVYTACLSKCRCGFDPEGLV